MHECQMLPVKPCRRSFRVSPRIASVLGLFAIALQTGCASAPADEAGDLRPSSGVGSVSAALTLPGGDSISTLSWVITGPNGGATVVQQGTTAVQSGTTLTLLVGGLPAAANYAIALSGSSDGGSTCIGSLSFSVAAQTTTGLSIPLSCGEATADAGVLVVKGQPYLCGTVNGLWASPLEVSVGHVVTLTASASGVVPAALAYAWSASSGTFSAPSAASTTFTCTEPGAFTVTVAVSDGPIPDGGTCNSASSAASVIIQCSAAPDGGL